LARDLRLAGAGATGLTIARVIARSEAMKQSISRGGGDGLLRLWLAMTE
jgi:ribulose 1,5-bisphosphate synthetase/thiazole synthase